MVAFMQSSFYLFRLFSRSAVKMTGFLLIRNADAGWRDDLGEVWTMDLMEE
jgi:hypothetical protein